MMRGDDLRWAAPGWDDGAWHKISPFDLPARTGIYWLRFRIRWPDHSTRYFPIRTDISSLNEAGKPIDTLTIVTLCSYELYWDGRPIFRNGKVGSDPAAEVSGTLHGVVLIPSELRGPGDHVVAMRVSSFHFNAPRRTFYISVFLTNGDRAPDSVFPMIETSVGMGCALVAAIFCVLLFCLVDRSRPLVLCGLFNLAGAAYFLLITGRWLGRLGLQSQHYDRLYPLYLARQTLLTLFAFLVPWTFLERFGIPGKRWWLAAQGVLLAAIWCIWWTRWADFGNSLEESLWLGRSAFPVLIMAAVWAAWRRRIGARLALGAALIGLVSVQVKDAGLAPSFSIAFAVLDLALFASIGLQVQAARRAARAAELAAARMEIELLKKNFQPHFLLNTLTALSEVVELNPSSAVRLINDLSEEFRSLSRVSAEKLIPLGQELDLCRAHLRIMSMRTGKTWRLDARNVDPAALVPPALFLTLIENGFAHQRVASADAAFALRQESVAAGGVNYVFVSPGDPHADPTRVPGGTGLRYVKARLEESFPGRWSFRDCQTPAGWKTVIEIRAAA
jgi:hypothetical protein